ncbi:amino acid adenylation domain-containing protein [Nostoc sp. LEGE 12447]|uniref:non-ribosomal peptide synthetase n=1 Tax=Nostoc sp. LEGE 12447 TaxID=1828640 RepID=UPI001883119F|nr:non-ribosomal peptide synthetase [Nostoc sp. LEGE 12447]MBE8999505.1 amino acid adenylation domain-containing protein [Nostoc sp. LEGE 12447]
MITKSLELPIFSLVAKITGHDAEELERDMFLEGNLGLDSIKMMELLNGLVALIPQEIQPKFMETLPLQNLMQLQTLGDVVQIADKCLVSQIDNSNSSPSASIINQEEQKIEKIEILSGQYFHLLGHWVVNSISLFSTLRLRGDFDSNVAWQSWKDLLNRHPMLRSRFIIPPDTTRFKDYEMVVMENPTPPDIPVTDIRHLHSEAQEQLINDELHRCLNYEWQMTEWPLHRFFVFRLEDSVYQLVLANEHLISDALGCHVILREFMEIYRAHICGEQPNLQPPTTVQDYSELVQSINAWQDPEEDKALVEYVNRRGKDSYLWNPTGNAITSLCPKFHNRRFSLGKAITNQLIAQTREWRLPLNSLLVGAFVRAVAKFEKSKNEPIMVQVPTSGRVYPGIDASDVVGSFAQNLSISLDLPAPNEDWQRLLNRVHQEIQQGLVNGYDRAQTRQMAIAFRDNIVLEDGKIPERMLPMYRRILKSNLYCPFTGQTNIKNKYGPIDVIDYRAGGINAAGTIDILQEIFDDSLHLFASYDSNFFPESVIDELMHEYITQIKELASLKIPSQQLTQPLPKTQTDVNIAQLLQEIATEICHSQITANDMAKDLEAELGMDSLELIRIVTRLEKRLGKVNRQVLLSCRSLQEMAVLLGKKQSSSLQNQSVVNNQQPQEIPYWEIIEQAKRTPNAIAVTDGETQITYAELNRLSNQVANYLQAQGVKPGVFVGIMTRRGPLMFVGILGILKAGGTYVPLDPIYPHERIKYILEHAEIGILLTENRLTNKLAECLTEQLPLNTLMFLDEGIFEQGKAWTQLNKKTWARCSDIAPANVNTPDDLMTVLYTSGSTGKPKGVMLNHRGYMNRLVWMQNAFQLRYGDRVAQKTSCCFDISVWEIFWPLMVGATVYSVETETVKNPWLLAQWIKDNQINVMHFVPSLFGEFCNALESESWTFPNLRWLVFSGEALPVPFVQRWIDKYGMSVGLANLYGPTEASIDVTAHIIRQRPGEQEICIPIGKAIDNVYILILDEQMQPLAPGKMGELWIGGVQLAKGYLKDPQRTADAFRLNPFSHVPGEYLYKTGDLAMELPDGSFEYHGRIDHQIKIRGFRVELGEIESVLNSHPAINEAAVLAVDYENGQKRLIACLAGSQVDNQQIKEFLAQRLPDYMIPHRWEWLASLPKTHNGKLDRKAILAAITQEKPTVSQQYLPLGPAQRWLVKYFEAPYQWNGYTRFLFHQPLDAEIFNQALNIVLETHPALRTVFVQRDQQWWQQLISPEQKLSAEFYDGSHLTSAQRDSEIHNRIQEIAQQFQIDQWPLMKVIAIKVNESCYDISLVGHHIIGDLLSTGVIFNLLWLTYSELLGNRTQRSQPLPSIPSYIDYVRVLMQAEQQGALTSHVDYWKSQFPSQEYTFQVPFDHQKGANLEASAASEKFTLSKNSSNILLREAKQYYKCNVYTLLLSTLYRLMAEWSGQPWVVVSHRSHGRNLDSTHTFLNSVGNFAMNFPVGVNVGRSIKWEQTTKEIQAKFNELPMNGVTFDWISEQLPHHVYPDNNLTPVRANYLGNRTAPALELFEFIEEDRDSRLSSPDQKRTALLEFFFSITDGTVHLEIEYSRNFHLPATIRRLGDRYLELMAEMLAVLPLVGNGVEVTNHFHKPY